MIAKVTRTITDDQSSNQLDYGTSGAETPSPILAVLWRRRWTIALTLFASIAAGVLYLLKATPVYTSTATLYIEQQGAKVLSDNQVIAKSDTFLPSQAEVLRSTKILSDALENFDVSALKTFQGKNAGAAIDKMQDGRIYRVDVGKKNDIVTISMDSPYPIEAAAIVNKVVESYISHQSSRIKNTAADMLKILDPERQKAENDLAAYTNQLIDFKQKNGDLSFRDDKGSIAVQQLSSLRAEILDALNSRADLTGKLEVAKAALVSPERVKAFVQGLQIRGTGYIDNDYNELAGEVRRYQTAIYTSSGRVGEQAQQIQSLKAGLASLETELSRKERAIADAYMAQLQLDLDGLDRRIKDLNTRADAQEKEALAVNSKAIEQARLEGLIERTQQQTNLLETRIKEISINGEDTGSLNIQWLGVAKAEDKPTKPEKAKWLAVALVFGSLAGIGLALLREYLDQRLRSPDEVSAAVGLPILAVVPHMRGKQTLVTRGQHVHLESMSDIAEAYRTARTALFFGAPREAKTMLITSPAPGDGKSTTASNLAITLAQAGHRTVLVDCDFRKPTQHKVYELDDKVGLSSVIAGGAKLREAMKQTRVPNLYVLPCGPIPGNPSEILTGKRFEQVMKALDSAFDRIVIDSPPVGLVADAQILAASAGVTLLVTRINKTTRKLAVYALDALRGVGANMLGVLVNDQPRRRAGYGYYGRYGQYGTYGVSRRATPALTGPAADTDAEDRQLAVSGSHLSDDAIALGSDAGRD